jgi:hypothetical protein
MRAIAAVCSGLAAFACAPSGPEVGGDPEQPVVASSEVASEPGCGAIEIEASGPWRTDHPLFSPLRAGWHPRAENGWPVAVRDAVAPWEFPGHVFVQVQLEGVPRKVEACWVSTGADDTPDHRECGVLWQMLRESPVETWPRTAGDWARLVATADGASAVFTSPDELAQCTDAPAPIRHWTPGLRGTADAPQLTLLERFDNERSTTWLRVELGHRHGNLDLERREIATVMRDQARAAAPELAPTSDEVWPISDDPVRAMIGLRTPRTHPLWRTPVTDACPAVMFSSLTPDFGLGDTFSRVHDRLASIPDRRLGVSPSEVMLVHDRIALPGVRLVAAMDTDGACMMGWSHTHCLVTDDAAWCPDGTTRDMQAIVDRFALTPFSLSDAEWFELAMIMSGASSFVLEPALLSECTRVTGARATAPRVVRGLGGVTVEFTAIDDGDGTHYSVTIASGRVSTTARRAWTHPEPEDLLDGLE